ncbi:MAG: class B sortase [Oscillospiraceae bacterium]|nr:class B sortase [Oscillospiraceae bacterium]
MRLFWKKLNRYFDRFLIVVLVIPLLIVSWYVYDSYYVFHHTGEHDLMQFKPGVHTADAGTGKEILPEMIGWVTLDGTTVDYPIMQAPDNIRFLNMDPFGDYSLAGSIFLDCRNDPQFNDDYSLIYGHHMEYGRMFGALDAFIDPAYLWQHTTGTLYIGRDGEVQRPLEVFAALQVSAGDKEIFDPTLNQVRQFVSARIDTELRSEPILALSTCSDEEARIIVLCYQK